MADTFKIWVLLVCIFNVFHSNANARNAPSGSPDMEKITWDNTLTLPEITKKANLYTATGFISCFFIGYRTSLILPGTKKNIDQSTIYKIFSK